MKTHLRILLLEDNSIDAEIIQRFLKKEKGDVEIKHVLNKKTFLEQLELFKPDLILSDHALPQFNSTEALAIAREIFPDIPFIMITGTVSEEFAAEIIKSGADDYILKDRINRLPLAIDHALNSRKIEKEKKEAIAQLVRSEEKYRTIFFKSPLPKWIFDLESLQFLEVNEAAIRHYGYSQEEFLSMTIKDIRPREDLSLLLNDIKEMGEGDDIRQSVWRHQKKNGDVILVEATAHSIEYNNRRARMVVVNDITEKKLSEQQIEFDHNNLHALINNTRDLMWSVDRNYRLITSNQAFDELVSMMSGQQPAKGSEILNSGFSEEQSLRYKEYYDRAFSGETFTEIEYTSIPEDFWSEISFYPIYKGKAVIGTACFSRNITEQKHAEEEIKKSNERFELAASATNDVIWDWNMEKDEFWWNDNYYSYFGYDRQTIAPDILSWYESFHPEDKERVLAGIHYSVENKKEFWTDEYRFLKADGTVSFVLDCAYIMYDSKKKPYRMVGAMLDITARKKAEEQLKISLAEKNVLAERMAAILNTLPASIALLDEKGLIIDINDSWKNFADNDRFTGGKYNLGDNYLKIAQDPSAKDKAEGKAIAQGLMTVLDNKVREFVYEYSCDPPSMKRWFRMVATPLEEKEYAGAVVMHIDISELRRLEQERLEIETNEQKKITRAMLQAQEKERNSIGLELHDNVNQIIAVTIMQLSMIKNNPEKTRQYVDISMKYLQDAVEENRKIAHALVIPDFATKNLVDQLFTLTDNMLIVSGIHVHFDTQYFQQELLDDQQKLTVYRIAQEQCSNILKYAKARSVNLSLRTTSGLFKMTIADDGQGTSPSKKTKGIGLRNIKDRLGILNGVVVVSSSPGKGFTLEITIPVMK